MIMDNRKEIVEKMINALNDRCGFDDWWHNIDEEIQNEITDELVNILPIQIVSNSICPNCKTNDIKIDDDLIWCYQCEKSYDC